MVLSRQSLKKLIGGAHPMINSFISLEQHLQPASLDLPIGNQCYEVSVSSPPREGESVESLLDRFALSNFQLGRDGTMLKRGSTYVIPLAVDLKLAPDFRAHFSSKSTTGRNGLFARNLSDGSPKLDVTTYGYQGKLYVEVSPLRFNTTIYTGTPLTQMRLVSRKSVALTNEELAILHSEHGIVRGKQGKPIEATIQDGALYLHLDLTGKCAGYESIANPEESVHIGKKEVDDRDSFWRPIRLSRHGDTVLHPQSFYLFATRERVFIPPEVCAFMEDYSPNLGEFSSHEAGFFDNYFGAGGGTQGVLEVHLGRMPIRFWDGRPVCRMVFYRTDEVPVVLYGEAGGSHYIGAGPRLAKNFKGFQDW